MRILRIKNYEKYQNHRAKNPQWVKLYRTVLTDQAFIKLDPLSRYVYLGLLILASETSNCVVNDTSYIAHRLAIDASQLNLRPLFLSGLLVASPSTIRRQKCLSETETETEKRESIAAGDPACALPPPVPKKPKAIKTGWPEGFQFNEQHKTLAEALGLNVAMEFAKFRDKAFSRGYTYVDWNAAFRSWLRNSFDYKQQRTA